jgi:hypothetical protein
MIGRKEKDKSKRRTKIIELINFLIWREELGVVLALPACQKSTLLPVSYSGF